MVMTYTRLRTQCPASNSCPLPCTPSTLSVIMLLLAPCTQSVLFVLLSVLYVLLSFSVLFMLLSVLFVLLSSGPQPTPTGVMSKVRILRTKERTARTSGLQKFLRTSEEVLCVLSASHTYTYTHTNKHMHMLTHPPPQTKHPSLPSPEIMLPHKMACSLPHALNVQRAHHLLMMITLHFVCGMR